MRDSYFDNLKFMLILLVVTGHLLEPFIGGRTTDAVYTFIYSFHMPLFVFVAGYFCKPMTSDQDKVRLIQGMVIPYFLFQTLYALFDYYALSGEQLKFSYFRPYWIMWFLFSSILWKALLPYVVHIRYPIAVMVAASLLAGYSADVEYFAGLSRTLYFFPFFLLGYFSKREWIDALKKKALRVCAIPILLAGFAALYVYADQVPVSWFFGAKPYAAFELSGWAGAFWRLTGYAFTMSIGVSVLTLVPTVKLPGITEMGKNTLYVFLLHGFIVKYMYHAGYQQYFDTTLAKIGLLLIGVAMTVVLSLGIVKNAFRWLVEPNLDFMFRNRESKKQASAKGTGVYEARYNR